ncbi:helix-turn-helix domain-containing protein [Bacillus zhangzhouensis]|nr:helix-turn-helix domain-containing protein [Bacillus zhangzhouensis]
MSFGYKLKSLRKSKKLTQKELAQLLYLSQSSIARFENEEILPTSDTLNKIANFFDVSTDYLLDRPSKERNNLEKAINEAIEELKEEKTLMFLKNGDIDEETAILIKKALKNGIEYAEAMKKKE